MARADLSLLERFEAKAHRTADGCWPWTGYLTRNGYGQIRDRYVRMGAHRAAYELFIGPIPDGLEVDHVCRNRACVNPAHLDVVTHAENVRRRDA